MKTHTKIRVAALAAFGSTGMTPAASQDIYNPNLDKLFEIRIEAEAKRTAQERKITPLEGKLHILEYLIETVWDNGLDEPGAKSKEQLPCSALRVAGFAAYQTGIEATKQLEMTSAQKAFALAQSAGELSYYLYRCAPRPDHNENNAKTEFRPLV